jgi:chromosome partitioning protein
MPSFSDAILRFAGLRGDAPSLARATVLAVAAQKGGVGKTTTSVNLAVALARFGGMRTLLVDLDGQGHVAAALAAQVREGAGPSLSDVLLGHGRDVLEIAQPTQIENLWMTPSDKGLAATEGVLAGRIGKEFLLRQAIRKARERFDVILFDCPPNLGNLTLNALTAAQAVLIPCDMSVLALSGVTDLLAVVETLHERLDHSLRILGIVPTRVDRRNVKVTEAVLDGLESAYGDLVCRAHIPVSSALARAQMEGVSVFDFDPASSGAVAYRALGEEVLARLGGVLGSQATA